MMFLFLFFACYSGCCAACVRLLRLSKGVLLQINHMQILFHYKHSDMLQHNASIYLPPAYLL